MRAAKFVTVILMVGALLAACSGAGAPVPNSPDAGGEPMDRDHGPHDAGHGVSWRPLTAAQLADLPDEEAAWVQQRQQEQGIFQQQFGDRTLIVVAWGEKNTSGYTVTVDDVVAASPDSLRMEIRLDQPEDTDVTGQVLTYPSAVIEVTPAGFYEFDLQFVGALFFQNNAFQIERPHAYSDVAGAVHIKGKARVFEGTFQVSIEDGHNILAHKVMQVAGAPAWGEFDEMLDLMEEPTSPYGIVYFYEHSAKDGSVINRIAIPVKFSALQ